MKIRSVLTVSLAVICFIAFSQKSKDQNKPNYDLKVTFVQNLKDQRVDVMVNNNLFTTYWWPDSVYKPVLYPILSAAGTTITRGFPIKPRVGERRDHLHQVGNWLNYGNVNGYDFWGNGSEGKRNVNGGQIKHLGIVKLSEGIGEGSMVTTASWIDPEGKEILAEKTELHFFANGSIRMIDRIVTLTATGGATLFKDTKEGSFGIRVARQLELPSKEDVTLSDAHGNPTTVKAMTNEGVTGNYRSSEGATGEAVSCDQRPLRDYQPPHKLTAIERAKVLAVANSDEFGHLRGDSGSGPCRALRECHRRRSRNGGRRGHVANASGIDFLVILVHHPVGIEEGDHVIHGIEHEAIPVIRPFIVERQCLFVDGPIDSEQIVVVAVLRAERRIGGRHNE